MDFRKERGYFISVEGPEFSGKTTAIKSFYQRFGNPNIIITREPGATEKGKILREWITNPEGPFAINQNLSAMGFAIDRALHISEIILPALKQGQMVISDRYIDSSYVLQGIIRGFGIDMINHINALANNISNIEQILPHKTIFFDVSEETALHRFQKRGNANLMDVEFMKHFKEIRNAYLSLAEMYPERYIVLNANGSKEQTLKNFTKIVMNLDKNKKDSN